jgi:hypothetical protein
VTVAFELNSGLTTGGLASRRISVLTCGSSATAEDSKPSRRLTNANGDGCPLYLT